MFSRNNWDDCHGIDGTGSSYIIKRASKLQSLFSKLSNEKWERIASEIHLYMNALRRSGTAIADMQAMNGENDSTSDSDASIMHSD